jgi:ATP-dependent Zn protease
MAEVTMSDMLRAAYHEAGHASVACAVGFKVHHIRLMGPDDGYVDYEGASDAPLLSRLSVVLAGHVAEGRATYNPRMRYAN